jgi:AcrR family transcriptional regulator
MSDSQITAQRCDQTRTVEGWLTMMTGSQPTQAAPAGLGRRERRRAETREKLYRTAMELFAQRGFFETTTEAITEAADVGQGTFFNYFPTKSHVLIVLCEKQIDKVVAAQREAEAGHTPMRDVFYHLIHAIVEELARSQALTRSLLTAFVSHDDVRALMRDTLARGRERLVRICSIGQARQEIRRDRRAADLAMTFQRGVLGTLLLWAMHSQGDVHTWLEKTLEDFWAIAEPTQD